MCPNVSKRSFLRCEHCAQSMRKARRMFMMLAYLWPLSFSTTPKQTKRATPPTAAGSRGRQRGRSSRPTGRSGKQWRRNSGCRGWRARSCGMCVHACRLGKRSGRWMAPCVCELCVCMMTQMHYTRWMLMQQAAGRPSRGHGRRLGIAGRGYVNGRVSKALPMPLPCRRKQDNRPHTALLEPNTNTQHRKG